MAKVEIILPQMGEGVIEATITRWLVDLNDTVSEDDPVVEIATDKVDSEVPAPVSGVIVKQFYSEGEVPKVGDVLAIIDDGGNSSEDTGQSEAEELLSEKLQAKKSKRRTIKKSIPLITTPIKDVSLFIKQFSKLRGVSSDELKRLSDELGDRDVTKQDILEYITDGRPYRNQTLEEEVILEKVDRPAKKEPEQEVAYTPKEGEEIINLDRTRQLIADHMVKSLQTAPHVTSFVEVDVTPLVEWRNKIKKDFKSKYGYSLTFTPIITEMVVKALKEYPRINATLLASDKLLLKKYINIGIATALPDNNLIVPVVKNADRKSLSGLAKEISDLTGRARNAKLLPGETNDGTFTITNLGLVGNVSGTPIINQPQSAILAVGAIQKKAGVVKVNNSLTIGIRDILTLSLSYDHRTVDGALGGAFLSRIGQLLESYTPPQIL